MSGTPEIVVLPAGPNVPNSRLPVLIYRQAGPADAAGLLRLFETNRWRNGWRNGIFPFHHFHAIAHEVLGIARGSVQVRIGGEGGRDFTLEAGDVVVLPAGTGHKRLSEAGGLDVVGAYPDGCDYDLIRADAVDAAALDQAMKAIAAVPPPTADPVFGAGGPLLSLWAEAGPRPV